MRQSGLAEGTFLSTDLEVSRRDRTNSIFFPDLRLAMEGKLRVAIVGAGPVGSLAALYAANRGHSVEIYELRGGAFFTHSHINLLAVAVAHRRGGHELGDAMLQTGSGC